MRSSDANCRPRRKKLRLYIRWGFLLQIVLLPNLDFGISWDNLRSSKKAQEKLCLWNKYVFLWLWCCLMYTILVNYFFFRLPINHQPKLRTLVCGCVMIQDRVHTTCTVNTETPLLLVPSLNATEIWVLDIEPGLMLSRYWFL